MMETTSSKYIITAAAIVFTICCICLLVPSATAETIAFTATYNYLFTQLETEDQARIIALARTRQAIFNAAETAIRKTQIYQNALPVENLSHALASAVMTFETSSMVLNMIPQGHSLSLKLIGRLDMDTLETDLSHFIENSFLLDNALANRNQAGALLASLDALKEQYSAVQQSKNQKTLTSEKERLTSQRWHLVNQLSAISLSDTIIAAALKQTGLDPGETIKLLNRAVSLDDRNAWLYLHRGRVFDSLKDPIAASADFERAVLLNPYLIYAYEYQGDVLLGAGKIEDAVKSYSKAIDLDRQYGPRLLKRGRAYRKMSQYSLAAKDFTRTIEIAPTNPVGYLERGQVWIASGSYAEAEADFNKVLALIPEDAAAYETIGRSWMTAGLPDRACDELKKACDRGACDGLREATAERVCLDLDLVAAGTWAQTCYEAVVSGQWRQAIQAGTLAIYHNPDAVNPYINRSWAYAETGTFEKALEDVNAALVMATKNAMAFNNRGLVYEKQGDMDRAGKDYFRACELGFEIGCRNYLAAENSSQKDRSRIDLLLRKSGEAYRDNNWEAVIRLTSQVIEKEPESVQAYTVRAAAFSQTGQLQESIADCNAAIQINPNYGLAYNNRGYALEKMGQREDALVDYRVGCLLGADLSCRNYTRLESVLR